MGVRVRIRLKFENREVEAVGLANAGFEAEGPEIVLPIRVAERLGLWPELPKGSKIEEYEVAGGKRVSSHIISQKIDTKIITKDRSSERIKATPILMEKEKEVVLSDKLIGAHKVVLEDVGRGLWRFSDEEKPRDSENPEYW